MNDWQTGPLGVALIKSMESIVVKNGLVVPYICPTGYPTIGWGCRFDTMNKAVTMQSPPITLVEAETLFRDYLNKAEVAIRKLVKVTLTQNQFDALVSFTLNLGETNLKNSTLLKLLNSGDYLGSWGQFPAWNKGKVNGVLVPLAGLTTRRAAEQKLFTPINKETIMINSRDINELLPEVKVMAEAFREAAKKQGIDILITSTYRDNASQTALYNQGRTTPGNKVTNAKAGESFHNYRCALDFAPLVNGKINWNDTALFTKCGKIAESVGFEWAGNWKTFKELAHVQYSAGLTLADLKAGKSIEAAIKTQLAGKTIATKKV